MSELSITEAREELADVVNRVQYRGERAYLTRHGKQVAVIVPVSLVETYEALENQTDLAAAHEASNDDNDAVPWDDVNASLPEAAVSNEFGGLLRDLVRARTLLEGGVSAGTVPSVQAIELVRELGSTRARLGAVFAGLVGETSGQSVEALPEAELTEG